MELIFCLTKIILYNMIRIFLDYKMYLKMGYRNCGMLKIRELTKEFDGTKRKQKTRIYLVRTNPQTTQSGRILTTIHHIPSQRTIHNRPKQPAKTTTSPSRHNPQLGKSTRRHQWVETTSERMSSIYIRLCMLDSAKKVGNQKLSKSF